MDRQYSWQKEQEWATSISWREHVTYQWDDDEVRFVLDQRAELDCYSATSLKQLSASRHVVQTIVCPFVMFVLSRIGGVMVSVLVRKILSSSPGRVNPKNLKLVLLRDTGEGGGRIFKSTMERQCSWQKEQEWTTSISNFYLLNHNSILLFRWKYSFSALHEHLLYCLFNIEMQYR
jgi:hypothetical protein